MADVPVPMSSLQPKAAVSYRPMGMLEVRCGLCTHFLSGCGCEYVAGEIQADYTCDLFESRIRTLGSRRFLAGANVPLTQGPLNYALSIAKSIRKEDGKFCVYSESGKSFGCYDSEAEAKKRLGQMEHFKKDDEGYLIRHGYVVKAEDRYLVQKDDYWPDVAAAALDMLEDDECEVYVGDEPPEGTPVLDLIVDEERGLVKVAPAAWEFEVTKAADEKRYTFGPLYLPDTLDAHGEYVAKDDLQHAAWDYVRSAVSKGSNTVYRQHSGEPAGEWVEIVSWPTEVTTKMATAEGERDVTFPAGTVFQGIVWNEATWPDVKAGKVRGLSLGGRAIRNTETVL